MNPLAVEIWLYVLAAYVLVSITMFIVARFSPYEWQNPHPCDIENDLIENPFSLANSFWFTIGTIMQQGSDLNPKESENLLNDDLSSQPNLNMRTNEQINDLCMMKIEEEMWFYPGYVAMDKGTIKGSTKNFITYKSINNSLNDGIINENSIECNCAYGDVTIENLTENISSENKLFEQKGKELLLKLWSSLKGILLKLKRNYWKYFTVLKKLMKS
ncbi:uncharacterized protein LOC142326662 [Lycorma delicatula]